MVDMTLQLLLLFHSDSVNISNDSFASLLSNVHIKTNIHTCDAADEKEKKI